MKNQYKLYNILFSMNILFFLLYLCNIFINIILSRFIYINILIIINYIVLRLNLTINTNKIYKKVVIKVFDLVSRL